MCNTLSTEIFLVKCFCFKKNLHIYYLWLLSRIKKFYDWKKTRSIHHMNRNYMTIEKKSYLLKAGIILIPHLGPTTPVRNLDQRELKPKRDSCSQTQSRSASTRVSDGTHTCSRTSRRTGAYWPRGIRTYKPSRVLPIISGPERNKRRGRCLFSSFELYAHARRVRAPRARAWINNNPGGVRCW